MDIFKLTKSKTREKILQLFLSLEKIGLFKREKVGKQVYYFLNKDSAFFEDFKNIVFKTIGAQGQLKKELEKIKRY